MTNKKQIFELQAGSEQTALDLLKSTGLDVSTLKKLAHDGSVWWQISEQRQVHKPKRLRRLKKRLKPADKLWVYYDPRLALSPVIDAINILDKVDYSVWFKPRGMFSQPSKWSDANSISRNVELMIERPTYLVHRLDRMTAGLILVSHKRLLVQTFSQKFASDTINKTYQVVVAGQLPKQQLSITSPLDGKPSRSVVSTLLYDHESDRSLLQVVIHSGRKHQIRRHLSEISLPVIGDRLYGNKGDDNEHDLQLIAAELSFTCPITSEPILISLPDEYLRNNLLLTA